MILVLTFSLAPATLLAQDDNQTDWAEYTSDNELVTFAYPPEWELMEEMAALNIFILSSAPGLIEAGATSLEPHEGDIILTIILLDEDTLGLIKPGVELPDLGLAPDELVTAVIGNIIDPYYGLNGETLAEEDVQIGEPEIIELAEDLEVGVIAITQADVETLNIAYPINDILLIASASVFSVESIDEETSQLIYDILAGFHFMGTAEDLSLFPE
jgi:hypothetical protein